MKGITPVIAVVLLLMIVIALAGFAFVWFQGAWRTMSGAAQQQLQQQQEAMLKTVKIDNVNVDEDTQTTTIYIRNTGALNVTKDELGVYIDNALATCTWSDDTIEPNEVETCTVDNVVCTTSVKVTAPGSTDEVNC